MDLGLILVPHYLLPKVFTAVSGHSLSNGWDLEIQQTIALFYSFILFSMHKLLRENTSVN